MSRSTLNVVAGLISRDRRFLVTRRPPDTHLGGYWEFPGGKREAGESDRDALRRELREELRLDVTVEDQVFAVKYGYEDRTVHLRFYQCVPAAGDDLDPEATEATDLDWVTPREMEQMTFPPADDELIDFLQERTPDGKTGASAPS